MQRMQSNDENVAARDRLIELMKKKESEQNEQWIEDMRREKDSLSNLLTKLDDPAKKKLGAEQLIDAADKQIKEAETRMQKAKTASSINVVPGEKKCTIEKKKDGSYNISGVDEKTMDKAINKIAQNLGYNVNKTKDKNGKITYHITHKDGKPLTPQEMKAFMAKLLNELKKELGAQNVNTGKEFAKELTASAKEESASEPSQPVAGMSSTS